MNFFFRKLLESKMKDIPVEQREMIISVFEKNPEFFKKIAEEIKALQDSGRGEQEAVMEVMQKYQGDLARLMSEAKENK